MAALARSVLVTGSSRGIGLELVRQLAASPRPPQHIFATCRDPEGPKGKELQNLASKHPNIIIIPLEVSDPASIKAAAAKVGEHLGGSGLNLLIHNAGVLKATSLDNEMLQDMTETYTTNTVGPLLMGQAFLPLLKKAAQGSPGSGLSCNKAAIVNISSSAGSIASTFAWELIQIVSYRCSKAALNMLSKCQSLVYKEHGILCVALHPGWVQTDMGSAVGHAPPVTVDDSVQGMLKVLSSLSEKDTGTFLDWEGNVIPCMAGLHVRSVLVTGANRGIGLGFVQHFLRMPNPPQWIFAGCRDPKGQRAQELQNLTSKHPNIIIIPLEVSDPASIKAAAAKVGEHLGGSGLNLLINNAGVLKAKSLDNEMLQDMTETYTTNAVGPLLMGQAFLPLLKKAAQGSPGSGLSCNKAAIVNISSIGGSIASTFAWELIQIVSYRCSKAALNMLSKCQSLAYKEHGILCVALHPGWVQTDMGSAAGHAPPVTVDDSVQGMLKVLSSLSEKDTGAYLDWEGNVIPW
ncbi:uncharacterized protein RBU47_007223 [Passerculus sandwichensis]